jgi:hypothetical protein
MKKEKTYWDEIKNEERNYCGQGWEVRYCREDWGEKPKFYFRWPFVTGDGVPRDVKGKCRKEVLFQRYRQKSLASISTNRDEYQDLMSRVGEMNKEEFRKLIENSGLKGFELRNYIQTYHWTYSESFASFWRG